MKLFIIERLDRQGDYNSLDSWSCMMMTDDRRVAIGYCRELEPSIDVRNYHWDRFIREFDDAEPSFYNRGVYHRIRQTVVRDVRIGQTKGPEPVNMGLGPPPESIGRAHTEPVPELIEDDTISRFRQLELD